MTTRQAEQVGSVGFALVCSGVATALLATAGGASTPCKHTAVAPAPIVQQQIESAQQPRCHIVQHGLYRQVSDRILVEDSNSVTGVSGITDEVEFTTATNVVPRTQGLGFGIRYHAHDVPEGATVTWRVVYPTPLRGFDDWRHDEYVEAGDHTRHVLYDFDHAWEMVPGDWRFEIAIDGRTRCDFTFTVK